jgi:hypothetical protein
MKAPGFGLSRTLSVGQADKSFHIEHSFCYYCRYKYYNFLMHLTYSHNFLIISPYTALMRVDIHDILGKYCMVLVV